MNSDDWLRIVAVVIGGYVLGSIPFGVIATRLGGAGDVRSIGSGSIGATNVLRTGRKDLALITVLGDGGKGAVAVGLVWLLFRDVDARTTLIALAAGSAFVGHLYPVWLGFKGGKGVATFFGTLLAAAWPVGILAGLAWLATAGLFRISSLAGLTAAALAPLFAFATDQPRPILYLSLFMAVLIFLRHRANISRLLAGTEPRIGAGKTPVGEPAA